VPQLGDIPDLEGVAPPENVLFVCKLNPLTEEDALEVIFGRFGKIKKCEVIRDWKTGDSLSYAFIEYFSKEVCVVVRVCVANFPIVSCANLRDCCVLSRVSKHTSRWTMF
jgi:hypothetical protein